MPSTTAGSLRIGTEGDEARRAVRSMSMVSSTTPHATVATTAPEELTERRLGARARHDVPSDGVECFGEIGRRRERVGPVGVPLVAGGPVQATVRPSHVAPQNP